MLYKQSTSSANTRAYGLQQSRILYANDLTNQHQHSDMNEAECRRDLCHTKGLNQCGVDCTTQVCIMCCLYAERSAQYGHVCGQHTSIKNVTRCAMASILAVYMLIGCYGSHGLFIMVSVAPAVCHES